MFYFVTFNKVSALLKMSFLALLAAIPHAAVNLSRMENPSTCLSWRSWWQLTKERWWPSESADLVCTFAFVICVIIKKTTTTAVMIIIIMMIIMSCVATPNHTHLGLVGRASQEAAVYSTFSSPPVIFRYTHIWVLVGQLLHWLTLQPFSSTFQGACSRHSRFFRLWLHHKCQNKIVK